LRVGNPTTNCPKCGKAGTVVTGESGFNNHGKFQAVHDSIVQCGTALSLQQFLVRINFLPTYLYKVGFFIFIL